MAFGNLTVDFKQLSRIPVRDRMALAQAPEASQIFGNLTPSQIAALFPDYYKRALNPMAGQVSSFAAALSGATSVGTGSSSTSTASTSTGTTTATSPSPSAPASPKFIQDIVAGVNIPTSSGAANIASSSKFEGSHSQKASFLTARLMKDLGLTKEQAAGFVGNLSHESAGLKIDIEEYAPNVHGTRGYGLAQWTDTSPGKGRRTNLINFAKERNIPVNDFETQYQFLLYELNSVESKALARIKSAQTLEEAAAAGVYFERPSGFTKEAWKTSDMISVAKRVHGWDSRLTWSKKSLQAFEDAETSMQITQGDLQTATAPITGEAPQGTGVTIENLKGTPADASATVVPVPQGATKTLLLSMGTNDWDNPKNTYQNTLDAINEGRRKGYNVVVVPPTGSLERIKKAHEEVMRAVNETGAPVEQPAEYSGDGYHPTDSEYKRIAQKYPASVVVGDSIAQGIGMYMDNAKVVATQSVQTDNILSKMKSEDVAKLETAQATAVPSNFDPNVFAQIDPRVKEWYDKASAPEKRLLEAAILQKGVDSINATMQKYPKATATSAGVTALEELGEINNVEYGNLGNRNNPVDPALMKKISAMVSDIYGPEYKAVIYSGGEPIKGPKVSDSGRHDTLVSEGNIIGGQAADLYITNRETGEVVPRAQQIKAAQYWQARQFGGVGLGMEGGGIHLDQVQRGEATGPDLTYRAWAYGSGDASQRFLTEQERSAMVQARSEDFDISTITIPKPVKEEKLAQDTAQVAQPAPGQPLPGAEPQTATPPTDPTTGGDVPVINTEGSPAQQTANTAPAMKLGGSEEIKEPNSINESMSLVADGKEVAKFNKNEEVNVADGKINVQNEYQKKTNETQQKTDKGMQQQQNTGSMKSVPSTDVLRRIPDGYSPISPSAVRAFASIKPDRHWEKGLMS